MNIKILSQITFGGSFDLLDPVGLTIHVPPKKFVLFGEVMAIHDDHIEVALSGNSEFDMRLFDGYRHLINRIEMERMQNPNVIGQLMNDD